ncbi:MAG: VWA domain-containing protein [Planctomycetes bacterium]|nr:VWA domain-containing protein [Planctomycetota bacterium]
MPSGRRQGSGRGSKRTGASCPSAAGRPLPEPAEVVDRLAGSRRPFLIGVRHHSPACAAALPALLEAFRPERILLELPVEFAPWLEWVAHPEAQAPLALAGVAADGDALSFYPFADFSPELATLRWARAHGVPVEPFDLPIAARVRWARERAPNGPGGGDAAGRDGPRLQRALLRSTGAADAESLWDQLVEARAAGAEAEAVRRAALLVGWAHRVEDALGAGVGREDLAREAYMRERLAAAPARARVACVVGAFHAAALLPEPLFAPAPAPAPEVAVPEADPEARVVTSLTPYSFELLDSRSGYPAGIRDPVWQQRIWQAGTAGTPIADVLCGCVVEIAREVRALGHATGVPDEKEALRVALDLARLRGQPGPGRRELLEAVTTALGHGELFGRGRVLARALDQVLVGRSRGRLAPGTPRSGLLPHVVALLAELGLPGPGARSTDPVRLRLDPLRSELDRRRQVALARLAVAGVPYGAQQAPTGAGETLTRVWNVAWTPATEARLELAGLRGVTLRQAAAGTLRAEAARLAAEDRLGARARLDGLRGAAEAGLAELARERLLDLMGPFLRDAGLVETVEAHLLVERIARGHVPGLPVEAGEAAATVPEAGAAGADFELFRIPEEVRPAELIAAAVRALEGLAGSDRVEDARSLLELVRLVRRDEGTAGAPGLGRLHWVLDALASTGAPLLQGAAGAARVLLGREPAEEFGGRMGSWLDGAADGPGARALGARLRGALVVAAPLFEADPLFAAGFMERVEAIADAEFLRRVPALRHGFDLLSPAARGRLLEVLAGRLGQGADPRGVLDVSLEVNATLLVAWAQADAAGRAAVEKLGLSVAPAAGRLATSGGSGEARREAKEGGATPTGEERRLGPLERWRLMLGRERDRLSPGSARVARALDELYGGGRGEGARAEAGGGREAPYPSAREWAEDLEALFGEAGREEVLGRAVEAGRGAAAFALDPERVTPSVELLEQVLSLKGGLAEGSMARPRKLVERVADALVEQLATRVRPALTGLATPRPTRRRGGPLDLRRTVAANLKSARAAPGGGFRLLPEQVVFRTRARPSLDWRVLLVVDVSGSMNASVIHSAILAAILHRLPAVRMHFVAFSTEVVDLTGRVDDPLGLLLEIRVGGGTDIARGLRYARELVQVPDRTLLVLLTDFEEGGAADGLLAEVRALVESGVRALGLASLDDAGAPRYCKAIAELVAGAGMPVAALTPLELARWIGERIRGTR